MDVAAADAEVSSPYAIIATDPADLTMVGDEGYMPRAPRAPKAGLGPSLESKRMQLYLMQLLADVGILAVCFALVRILVAGVVPTIHSLFTAFLVMPVFLVVALYNATYSQKTLIDWRLASVRVLWSMFVASALLAFLGFFSELQIEASRTAFALGIAMAAVTMVIMRVVFSHWVRATWGPNVINRLVIKAGGPEVPLVDAYHVDAVQHALVPSIDVPAALDRLAQYLVNMDQVIVSCPESDRRAWSEVLKGSGVRGEVISNYARDIGALGIIHHADSNIATLLVSTGPLAIRERATKRVFDVAVSLCALLALSPLLLVIAAAIKLEDGGSVFFKQRRMGQGNRFFSILKFRSMREDTADADGSRSTAKDDDRITRIGGFMRKTSIDELPQLLNVVRGDMSLVGPRPHALGSHAGTKLFWQVDRRYWQRHSLKPGITGLAQVRGYRGATDTEQDLTSRLQADLEYVQGWTIWRDIGVLFSTLKVIVHDRAY